MILAMQLFLGLSPVDGVNLAPDFVLAEDDGLKERMRSRVCPVLFFAFWNVL